MIPKGHKFEGPDGQGYTLTRDLSHFDVLTVGLFDPYGGAPEPVAGEAMVDWLRRHISRM